MDHDAIWHNLPCVYEHRLSSATMLARQLPFIIGVTPDLCDDHAPLHWHDTFEIGYVLEGSGVFVVEGRETHFRAGHVHVINDTYRHMAYAFERARFFNVHFHPDLLRDTSFPALEGAAQRMFTPGAQRFAPLLPVEDPHTAQIVALLQAIAAEHNAVQPHWPLAVKGLILQIVSLLQRHFVAPEPLDSATLRRQATLARLRPALHLLEQRLTQPLALATLAEAVALSPSRFSALFHEAMGSSPVTYRNARRIALARRLLATSNTPIALVAEQCGFATIQQFNRVFRRMVGRAPSSYRAQAQAVPLPQG